MSFKLSYFISTCPQYLNALISKHLLKSPSCNSLKISYFYHNNTSLKWNGIEKKVILKAKDYKPRINIRFLLLMSESI